MKQIIIILYLFLFTSISNAQLTIQYDTTFYKNKEIEVFDYIKKDSLIKYEIYKSEGLLKDGLKLGEWKTWDANGNIEEIANYKIITKSDINIINHQDCDVCIIDEKKIREQLNNKYEILTGKYFSYYKNGKIKESGEYLPIWNLEFSWVEVYENDNLYYVNSGIPYVASPIKIGIWKQYDENGKLISTTTYNKQGKEIENKEYE